VDAPRLSVLLSAAALALLVSCQTTGTTSADGTTEDAPAPDSDSDSDSDSDPFSFLPDDMTPDASEASESARPALSTPDRPEDFARWERHPVRARDKARALKRPLLVLFTGLAWSENARLLGEEVFLSKSFNALAREHLVLLFLDFPQNPGAAPEALQRFKEHYRVSGIPSILLLSTDGTVLHRQSGYPPGKAQDYFAELRAAVLAAREAAAAPPLPPG